MNLPFFSLKRRVTTFMIYIAATIFGTMSLLNMPLDYMPSIEIPVALVQTTYPGAGAEEIESLVTEPIEQSLATISSVETLQSTSAENVSFVVIMLQDDTDVDDALVEIREKVDLVAPRLPDDASTPIVSGIDMDALPVVEFSMSADMPISSLEAIAEDTVIPQIERVFGVASVESSGGYDNIIRIDTDSEKLRTLGLSINQVSNILASQNVKMPSGEISYGERELSVTTDGEFQTVEDVSNVLIPIAGGATVKLSEIAEISLVPDEISSISKVNDEEVIMVSAVKQSGTNTSAVAKDVAEVVESLSAKYPEISFTVLQDQSVYVDLSVNSVAQNLLLGIFFSIIVLFVFLRRISPTIIIATSMPICIITTFLIMTAFNLTLNTLTLGAMAIGVGMIVDNSVVVLENIYRFYEDGHSKFEACLEGSKEVALSITASTATTIAVFLPIGLSGGMVGMMFNSFSLTVTSLLIASLLIALTLVPLLCYLFIDKVKHKKDLVDEAIKPKKNTAYNKFLFAYQRVLKAVLKRQRTSLLMAFILFIGFLASAATVGAELIPASDQSLIQISASLPVSSRLEEAEEFAETITERVSDIPEIKNFYYTSESDSVSFNISLVSIDERERSVYEIADEIREDLSDIAGAEITINDGGAMDMSAMSGSAISLSISGEEIDVLQIVANDLVKLISQVPGAVDVTTSAANRVEQVNIRLKPDVSATYGLSSMAVSSEVSANLSGVTATAINSDGDEIDVVVKGDESSSSSITALENMLISTQKGPVPLGLVADVTVDLAPQSISRENQAKTVTITGSAAAGVDTFTLMASVNEVIAEYNFPDGYYLDQGGETEELIEMFSSLTTALIVSILLIYFILASQFESLKLPFIIMLAMPLGLAGGLFGLFVTGLPLSMPAFIGVIMLSGIVVNNSIVLIDYIKIREDDGEDMETAILNACPLRIRPVLMTTLTTILGLLPMIFMGGEGTEMMIPMAIVMISGLVISTIITLVFSPVFYSYLNREKKRRFFKKRRKGV